MIAFACGIAVGSAFGACVMGLLWANARDRRTPSVRLVPRRSRDARVKKLARVAVGAEAMMH